MTWLRELGTGMRVKSRPQCEMERLPTLNRRLHDLRRIASRLKRSRMTPLQVCEATLGRPGGFLTTSAAFARLAQAASRRLVVMSPFIDAGGFRWLRRVFEATRMDCQKIVVLRNAEQYSVELGVQHADWLRALRVSVRDYHLSHDAASGRALPIETFHAKLIVADDTFAYVGSANLLNSSEGLSLETGLLVEGATAIQVARLVDAVLRVARAL
jgi:hypothetical protein